MSTIDTNKNSDSIEVKILFFAKSRELSGGLSNTILELLPHNKQHEYSCSDLLTLICDKYNLNLIKNSIILAINEEYCDDLNKKVVLKSGDELAIIPPLSGG